LVVSRPAVEVTLPPPSGFVSASTAANVETAARAVIWPQICCCCGTSEGLGSIPIYCDTTFGRNAAIQIPYCRRCQSHRRRAIVRALESGGKVFVGGLMMLLILVLATGMLIDPVIGFVLQLIVLAGAVLWAVSTYFTARAEIAAGITDGCSAAQATAVRFWSARASGWRFRFFSRTYAEQFAAANGGAPVETLYV
jgi:hypothetical protein